MRVSPLAFGSMRIHERELDDAAWEVLLRAAHERGVTTLHSSSEYESFPRFCSLVGRLHGLPFQHIVKLADPHFGEAGFDARRFARRIDEYLVQLGIDRIDVVQWMWRGDLQDEPGRLAGYARQRDEIAAAFAALRAAGKLGAVAPFPYTAGFADQTIGLCEGLAVYLNALEHEMLPQIRAAAAAGMGIVAIRPLAAGRAIGASTPAACIRGVLREPGVATAVVTFSSRAHLDELLDPT